MLEWVHVICACDDWQLALDGASQVPARAASPLLDRVRKNEAPPVALEVLAGLTGTIQTKDYRMRLLWEAAWALIERPDSSQTPQGGPAITQEERAEIARIQSSFGDKAAASALAQLERELEEVNRKIAELRSASDMSDAENPDIAMYLRARLAGPQLADLKRGHAPESETPPVEEYEITAARVAPIGIDGASRSSARTARSILWRYRDKGLIWEALCAALDAVGAASHAGLERLRALADAHPDSPAILWLDEMACRVARDDRAEARASQLTALLASGALGRNAPHLVYVLQHGREQEMAQHGVAIHDAWLRLGAMHRPAPRREDARDMLSPAQLAAIRRGAKQGAPAALAIVSMDVFFDRLVAEESREMDLEGPFHGLDSVPPEVEEKLDIALHYLIHGFRETYALELLRDGVPRLAAWLSSRR